MIISKMGVPVGHYVTVVTKVTLVNNTALAIDTTVPAGKRWRLLAIQIHNPDDVVRAVTIRKFKEAAKTNLIAHLESANVNAGARLHVPNNTGHDTAQNMAYLNIMDEGYTIEVNWAAGGASTGGSDDDGLVLEYLEVDL